MNPVRGFHRHVRTCIVAGLVLGAHLALGLALGPAGQGASGERALSQALTTVHLLPQSATSHIRPPHAERTQASRRAPAAPLLPLVTTAAHYFPAAQLSEYPRVLEDVSPDLDRLELPHGPDQFAVLRLLINERGDIDQVEVLRSELADEVMTAAIAAYSRLRFRPGKIGRLNVKSRLEIELRLEDLPPAV